MKTIFFNQKLTEKVFAKWVVDRNMHYITFHFYFHYPLQAHFTCALVTFFHLLLYTGYITSSSIRIVTNHFLSRIFTFLGLVHPKWEPWVHVVARECNGVLGRHSSACVWQDLQTRHPSSRLSTRKLPKKLVHQKLMFYYQSLHRFVVRRCLNYESDGHKGR